MLGGLVMGLLGVAGWRSGFAICAFALGGGAAGSSWVTSRSIHPLWLVTAAVAGLVVAGILVDVSPPSTGRLTAELDGLHLPYRRTGLRKAGHSWCLPECPRVDATFETPPVDPRSAVFDVISALERHHVIGRSAARYALLHLSGHVAFRSAKISVDVEAVRDSSPGLAVDRLEVVFRGYR